MKKTAAQLRAFDDADLDVYQFRLLMHYWRVGVCWEGVRSTAQKCGISVGKVSQTKQWLIDNKFIEKIEAENGRSAVRLCSPHEHFNTPKCSPHEHICSPHEQPVFEKPEVERSPHERKRSIYKIEVVNGNKQISKMANFFTEKTGLFPSNGSYDSNWRIPLESILKTANSDTSAAMSLMADAVQFAASGESGKTYTIVSPRSIVNIVANMARRGNNGKLEINAI
jgi:hypothetical protein